MVVHCSNATFDGRVACQKVPSPRLTTIDDQNQRTSRCSFKKDSEHSSHPFDLHHTFLHSPPTCIIHFHRLVMETPTISALGVVVGVHWNNVIHLSDENLAHYSF